MPGFDPTKPSSLRQGSAEDADGAASYDPEAVRAKYLAERDKRLVPGAPTSATCRPTSTSPATVTTRSRRSSSATRSPTTSMS